MKSGFVDQTECFETPAGWITLHVRRGTILRLQFQKSPIAEGPKSSPHRETILAWFEGEALSEKPLDLSWATPFERSVYAAVQKIPRGHVRTYGEVAEAVGSSGGARAVGGAMRRNLICLYIP